MLYNHVLYVAVGFLAPYFVCICYILPISGLGSVFEIANVLLLHVFLYRS